MSFPHVGQAHSFQVGTKLSPLASPRHHRRRHIYRSSFGAAKIKRERKSAYKNSLTIMNTPTGLEIITEMEIFVEKRKPRENEREKE